MAAFCAGCGKVENQIETPLQQCSACHTERYCSRDCQKQAWHVHKAACREALQPLQIGQPAMALTLAEARTLRPSSVPSASREAYTPDTVYYLMTATPHSYDLSFLGLFYPLDAIIPQVIRSFGQDYTQGSVDFHDKFIRNRHVVGFDQITVLDRYDRTHKQTVQLVKEHNPHMATKLPADGWVVYSGESGHENTMA